MENNICRTCLRSPSKLLPLNNNNSLIEKIETIASISIQISTNNEHYPMVICEECASNVNTFFCFRKVIINSDKELRERYDTLKRTNFTSKPRRNERKKACNVIKEEGCTQSDTEAKIDIFFNEFDGTEEVNNSNSEKEEESDFPESDFPESGMNYVETSMRKWNEPKCAECKLTFTSRLKLYNHRRTMHIAPGICNICGLVVRADNLNRHIQMHSEGPATCKICEKVFKNPESLRGHLLIHKGLLFTCEICGKIARVKSEHRRHMKTHLDPEARKVMCNICGKRVRGLRKHMLSHTGERPYTCSYCNKGFTSPYALKVHTRQHTNEKPFICEYCSLAFPQKVSLTTHLKSKHNVIHT